MGSRLHVCTLYLQRLTMVMEVALVLSLASKTEEGAGGWMVENGDCRLGFGDSCCIRRCVQLQIWFSFCLQLLYGRKWVLLFKLKVFLEVVLCCIHVCDRERERQSAYIYECVQVCLNALACDCMLVCLCACSCIICLGPERYFLPISISSIRRGSGEEYSIINPNIFVCFCFVGFDD